MEWKFIISLIIGILLVSFTSAYEWDNVKSYDNSSRTLIIDNALGLGGNIAIIKSETPTYNLVYMGNDVKVAEYNWTQDDNYTEGVFDGIEFYDLNNGNKIVNRSIVYKYKVGDKETVIYDIKVCKDTGEIEKNGTVIVDCHLEQRTEEIINERWEVIDDKIDLPKGNYNIGIFTDVKFNDKIEFIPTWYGVRVTEFSTWADNSYALNTGIRAYYNFNNTDSQVNNATNSLKLLSGSPVLNATNGKIGKGVFFDGIDDAYTIVSNGSDIVFNFSRGGNYTLSYWERPNGAYQMGKGANSPAGWDIAWGDSQTTYQIRNKTNLIIGANPTANIWNMFTLTINSTDTCWFRNGTRINCKGSGMYASPVKMGFTLGANFDTAFNYGSNYFDEMGWWYRTLSDAEITQLYNGGTGLTYVETPVSNPCIYGGSGDYNLDCSLYCNTSSSVDLGHNDFITNGTGVIYVNESIVNIDKWILSNGCQIVITNGKRFG